MSEEVIIEYLNNAVCFLAEKDFNAAKDEYEKVLEKDTSNVEALKGLGLCYFNLKNNEKAMETFEKALKIDENDATALYYTASLSVLLNKTEDAIFYAKKVIELRPDFFDAYKILFTIYLKNKRFKDIIELNEQFEKQNIETTDDTIHMVLSTTFMLKKDYKKAIEILKIAKRIAPQRIQIYNNLGVCYMSLKDYDAAINMFQISLSLDANNPLTYTDLGTVLQMKGDFLKALEVFNKALELEPTNFLNLLNVANLSNVLKKYDITIEAYEKMLKINPDLKDIRNSLIGAYVKNGQPDKAINLIDVALETSPKNVPLLFRKAKIYTDLKDFNAAQKIYEQIITFKKNSPAIYHAYALLFAKMEKYDKALQYLNKSMTLDEKNASVHKDFGVIYLMRNQVEYAKDEFDKAAELGQDDNDILKECADFYYSISDFKKSEDLYRKSLILENNPFTSLSLGINLIAQNKLDEAFAILEPLMGVLPNNAELLYSLARIMFYKKDYEQAARLAKKAYFIVPTIEIANLLGLSLMNLEDYKGASNIFDKIIEKYPLNEFIYEDLIKCYTVINDLNGLIKTYVTAINNLPYNENYVIEMSKTALKLNQTDGEVKQLLDKAYYEHPSTALKEYVEAFKSVK